MRPLWRVAYADQKMLDDPVKYGCTPMGGKYVQATREAGARHCPVYPGPQPGAGQHRPGAPPQEDRTGYGRDWPERRRALYHLLGLSPPGAVQPPGRQGQRPAVGAGPDRCQSPGPWPSATLDNDIDMLRLAGVGVAVADATGSCRAAADRQTRASFEDGVAWALREILNLP